MPVIAKVTSTTVTTGPVQEVDLYKRTGECTFSRLGSNNKESNGVPAVCALPNGVDYKDIWLKRGDEWLLQPHNDQGWTVESKTTGKNRCSGGCGRKYVGVTVKRYSGGIPTPRNGTPPTILYGTYPGHLTRVSRNGNLQYHGQRTKNFNDSHGKKITWYEGYRGRGLAMTFADFSFSGFGFRKYAYSVNGNIHGTFDCPAEVNGRFTLNFRVNRADGDLAQKGDNAMQLWGYDSDTTFMIRKCVIF